MELIAEVKCGSTINERIELITAELMNGALSGNWRDIAKKERIGCWMKQLADWMVLILNEEISRNVEIRLND